MRTARRYAPVAGLLALVLAAACGSGAGSDQKLKIGLAVANNSQNFGVEMMNGGNAVAAKLGNVDFQAVGPPSTDGPAEQQLFQNLTQTSRDGIVLMNLDPPLFTRPAARAIDQGIPVIAMDTAPLNGSKITLYVGNDNYEIGQKLADAALKRLPDDPSGEVVVGVPNPGAPVLDSRAKGIKDTLNKKAPKIKVLGPYQTFSDPGQNYNAWSQQVHAHPKALAFLGVGDADSYDLARIKQQDKGKYLVAGTDVDEKTLEYVKKGVDFVTIDPEHFLKGYVSTALVIKSVRSGTFPKGWFKMPSLVVDKSNIDEIIERQKSPAAALKWYQPQIDKLLGNVDAQMHPLGDAR